MRTRSLTVPALAAVLLTVTAAHASPIFSQDAFDTGFPSEREFDTLIADDFSIATSDSVRSISWSGVYAFDGTAPPVDDFEIRFYDDVAGAPDALLQTFAVGNVVARTADGTLGSYTVFRYTADLGTGFSVDAGTPYWLAVANETVGDNDNWYWAVQTQGGNVQVSLNDGAVWAPTLVEAAASFTLDNANVTVPEPASLLLVGTGVATALLRRRQG